MTDAIESFRIHVCDELLADLRDRLTNTRYPDPQLDAAWEQGTDVAYLRELCAHHRRE